MGQVAGSHGALLCALLHAGRGLSNGRAAGLQQGVNVVDQGLAALQGQGREGGRGRRGTGSGSGRNP